MMLLLSLFILSLAHSIYLIVFAKFVYSDFSKPPINTNYGVSVIVCAKNEAENLKENIPLILAQEYSNFEVILINDASYDETPKIIDNFAQNDPRVHTVHIENNEAFWSNKKYSLTLGIKRAKNTRMLFIDADCKPATNQWLANMASLFSDEKQLILGYGAYETRKGLLNRLIRFETLHTAIQYFSYAKAGNPYMGVGRNIGYTSNLFYDNRGFMTHMQIHSGDDDLFVNEVATAYNTALCVHSNAFTYSQPKTTWNAWFQQKRRHITTAKYYKKKDKTLLGIYYLTNFLFWTLLTLSFLISDWKIALAILIFRLSLQYTVFAKACTIFKEKGLIFFIPLFEIFLILFQLTIFISNSVSKPKGWT